VNPDQQPLHDSARMPGGRGFFVELGRRRQVSPAGASAGMPVRVIRRVTPPGYARAEVRRLRRRDAGRWPG